MKFLTTAFIVLLAVLANAATPSGKTSQKKAAQSIPSTEILDIPIQDTFLGVKLGSPIDSICTVLNKRVGKRPTKSDEKSIEYDEIQLYFGDIFWDTAILQHHNGKFISIQLLRIASAADNEYPYDILRSAMTSKYHVSPTKVDDNSFACHAYGSNDVYLQYGITFFQDYYSGINCLYGLFSEMHNAKEDALNEF